MKKVLLISLFLLTTLGVLAYETIIIKYPAGELWVKAYYKKVGNEAILQYLPAKETRDDWKRTIVIHAYYDVGYPIRYFIASDLAKMKKTNPTGRYTYLKLAENDAMATRCTDDYKNIKGQCEFYKASLAHGGIITVHYINRDKEDFMKNYNLWYSIIKNAKYYNTYYRDERTLDKAEYFELW